MGGDEIVIRWALGRGDVRGAIAVRERVFCREQNVPRDLELDGLDGDALHLVALAPDGRRVIATLRLLVHAQDAKIGRVAVEGDWRRRGIGLRMLEAALLRARELGCSSARLAAQTRATQLYQRAGFSVQSAPFEQAGIEHVWMGRALGRR